MCRIISISFSLALACLGCSTNNIPSTRYNPTELAQTPRGDLTLYVSNQSYAIPLVDIQVYLDGKLAVAQGFDVGNQHNWTTFTFDLGPGEHHIKAVSITGGAEYETTFEVGGRNWAVLDYWYHPDAGGDAEPTPRSFTFNVHDEPIVFQ